jgi:hypothetical protein
LNRRTGSLRRFHADARDQRARSQATPSRRCIVSKTARGAGCASDDSVGPDSPNLSLARPAPTHTDSPHWDFLQGGTDICGLPVATLREEQGSRTRTCEPEFCRFIPRHSGYVAPTWGAGGAGWLASPGRPAPQFGRPLPVSLPNAAMGIRFGRAESSGARFLPIPNTGRANQFWRISRLAMLVSGS